MSEWIKCSERMPDFAGGYLVYIQNDPDNGDGCYMEFWVHNAWENFDLDAVTHWMPLPEPPAEGL